MGKGGRDQEIRLARWSWPGRLMVAPTCVSYYVLSPWKARKANRHQLQRDFIRTTC